jgi:hypothetical protein
MGKPAAQVKSDQLNTSWAVLGAALKSNKGSSKHTAVVADSSR